MSSSRCCCRTCSESATRGCHLGVGRTKLQSRIATLVSGHRQTTSARPPTHCPGPVSPTSTRAADPTAGGKFSTAARDQDKMEPWAPSALLHRSSRHEALTSDRTAEGEAEPRGAALHAVGRGARDPVRGGTRDRLQQSHLQKGFRAGGEEDGRSAHQCLGPVSYTHL